MDLFVIEGGARLSGRVKVHGAKNAALPLMAASLLTLEPLHLTNMPVLADIRSMTALLETLGVEIEHDRSTESMILQTRHEENAIASYDIVRKMRASICVLGPLLARRGRAVVSLPGGCNIGHRPIDLHLKGLAALGADLRIERGYVVAQADRLKGNSIDLSGPHGSTVTGTCNILTAATLAKGETIIRGAAREPEVIDLGHALVAMGARIAGLGSSTLVIQGVDQLGPACHQMIPDRIEAATLMCATAMTSGQVTLEGVASHHLTSVINTLETMGCQIVKTGLDSRETLMIKGPDRLKPIELSTGPYPEFPTDVQAQMVALACRAQGRSRITDRVFPDRFMHVSELARLGARIRQEGCTAVIDGGVPLLGAPLMASDLRASAALVLAGLASEGQTVLRRIYHLDRGYQQLDVTLAHLGARIHRQTDQPEEVPHLISAESASISSRELEEMLLPRTGFKEAA